MKILPVKVKTLVTFGAGFLLGSRAGTGPWEMFCAKVGEAKGKLAEAQGGRAAEVDLVSSSSGDGRLPITSV